MPFGTQSLNGEAVPTYAPAYTRAKGVFTGTTAVGIAYRVAAAQVAPMVPSVLELEDEPLVTSIFLSYEMSPVGAYTEFAHQVEVTYQGTKYHYNLLYILDNDAAIFAGRELLGFPKVLGKTAVESYTGSRLVSGRTERPAGRTMVEFEFVPEQVVIDAPQPDRRMLNLRSIPSPRAGEPPSVREFLPCGLRMQSKETWLGKGAVRFPRKGSVADPWANLDVLRYETCFYTTNATAEIIIGESIKI